MRRLIFTFALLQATVAHAADWAPPSANQGAWLPGVNVGVPGGIEQYLAGGVNDRAITGNVINVVTAHGADNTGMADVKAAVESAISAASSGDVIYFPAGTYLFASGGIGIPLTKSNITLRGAGVGITTFHISTAAGVFIWADPGYIASDIQTVTGTKTKGTSTLSVSSSSGFTTANQFAWVGYENENDNTRIQAGAAPVWSSRGYPWSRTMTARVTGTTSTTISIDPPLPADATNLSLRIHTYGYPTYKFVGWGFEDFSVTFDPADHTSQVFNVATAQDTWFYNIHFEDWAKTGDNGSCIKISKSYRVQVQKCRFDAESGSSSDGAIETAANSSCLIADNIFTGPWGFNTYESGNSVNCVIAYNYAGSETVSGFHNTHPSLNLVEGNAAGTHHSDGYHGSSSHNTIYRNRFISGNSVILNRFKRNYVLAGNLFGKNGVTTGGVSWGNPNMGNGDANGFAGPTGLSDQVGQYDYMQNGGTPNTYVIQEADVFAGDFWTDWETTGTLTTRTSDTVGVFTVSGGRWFTGDSPTANGRLYPTIWWNSKANGLGDAATSVTAVSGSEVTITFASGSLPIQGTVVQMYYGNAGWQERDLDVKASSTLVENYWAASGGAGSLQDGTADTLPPSLAWTSKPAWFGNLPWPPYDPDSPSFDETRIPAGYRYINGNEDYLGGAATPQYSPAPGTYATAQTVTITTGSSAPYTIYYTIDGSTPTTSSTVYSSPVLLPSAITVLKAITVKSGLADSSVQSGTYTLSTVPDAPSSLTATAAGSTQINLAWTDNSSTETGFRIERRVGAGSWSTVTTTAANATSYSNTGLTASTTYEYRVFAVNVAGDSAASNTASATTQSEGGGGETGSANININGNLIIQKLIIQ